MKQNKQFVLSVVYMLFTVVILRLFWYTKPSPIGFDVLFTLIPLFLFGGILLLFSIIKLFRSKRKNLNSTQPLLVNLLTLGIIYFSFATENPKHITDDYIIIWERNYSTDQSKLILEFQYDHGAFGESPISTAILNTSDTLKNLVPFILPWMYRDAIWVSDDTIEVQVDVRRYEALGLTFTQEVEKINDVRINVKTNGFEFYSPRRIINRSLSPDSTHELVEYTYGEQYQERHRHFSAIITGDSLPMLGNLYIEPDGSYYVRKSEWIDSKLVNLYVKDEYDLYYAKPCLTNRVLGIKGSLEIAADPLPDINPFPDTEYFRKHFAPETQDSNEDTDRFES